MKKIPASLLVMLFIGLFLASAGCSQDQAAVNTSGTAGPAAIRAGNYTTNETLVAFVRSAVAYAKANGRERALAEFNNPNGSFIQGELYIYAYGFNGTTLAHPINPEKVGKNRLDEGATGVFVREMGEVVRNGSGFYRFSYINPGHNRTLESKLGYGEQVEEGWWLGSGVYTGPVNQSG